MSNEQQTSNPRFPDPEKDLFSDAMDAAASVFHSVRHGILRNAERAGETTDGEVVVRRSIAAAFNAYVRELRLADEPKATDEGVADARRWIAYLESEPQHEPDISIARVLRDLVQFYEWALPQITNRTAEPPSGWRPIETAPKDREVLFWVVPLSAEETYRDTSGNPITSGAQPRVMFCRFGRWSSLSKATHWADVPTGCPSETKDAPPPPPQPPPKRVIGEYAPGFGPRDADETSEGQSS